MATDNTQSQSQSQLSSYAHSQSHPPHKTSLGTHTHRSMSSAYSPGAVAHSPSSTPSTQPRLGKGHVVIGASSKLHKRVPSGKALHKLVKTTKILEGSNENLKRLAKNTSATNLKKNVSQSSLKSTHSNTEVINKRPKSAQGQTKRSSSVHFEIGDRDDDWEEASSSASPTVSRSASRPSSRQSTSKAYTDDSRPVTPLVVRSQSTDGLKERAQNRHVADARFLTERLLQRVPSYNTGTTKMSLATATPTLHQSPASINQGQIVHHGTVLDDAGSKGSSGAEVISRFVGHNSGTPSSLAFRLPNNSTRPSSSSNRPRPREQERGEEPIRTRSLHNISQSSEPSTRTYSALQPPVRTSTLSNLQNHTSSSGDGKESTYPHPYQPPLPSRTQQKLWLQRASSNIEPQMPLNAPITPNLGASQSGMGMNGYPFPASASLVGLGSGLGTGQGGGGKEAIDPRIRMQREKAGLEYLVVRRYRDPAGASLKRLGVKGEPKEREQLRGMAVVVGERERERIRELERERERTRGGGREVLSGTPGSGGAVWGAGKGSRDGKGRERTEARGHKRGQNSVDSSLGNGGGGKDDNSTASDGRAAQGDAEQGGDRLRALLQGLWERGTEGSGD